MPGAHRYAVTETLGEALKAKREEKGQSALQAAAEIGTSQSNYSRWETVQAVPEPPAYDGLEVYLAIDRAMLGALLINHLVEHRARRRRPRSEQ
jgi:transcriptional regulator with XRE-family HTH domain